jgi:MinD superfamily P-loop ATPase
MKIAIASGKGGTGKTLVSTALALCGGDCTYVDLDVEEPNGYVFLKPEIQKEIRYSLPVPEINEAACTFCEKCAEACSYNALAVIPSLKKTMFFPDLCHSCGCCSYVCNEQGALKEVRKEIGVIRIGKTGPVKFIEGRLHVGRPSGVPLISGIIENYFNPEDLFIIDSSPGTSCPVVESLKKSDYIVLVTEPTPFGLNDLKLTVEIVQELGKEAGIIVNKDNGKQSSIDDFSAESGIPILLKIPYSLAIQKDYSKGISLVESLPGLRGKFEEIIAVTGAKK